MFVLVSLMKLRMTVMNHVVKWVVEDKEIIIERCNNILTTRDV